MRTGLRLGLLTTLCLLLLAGSAQGWGVKYANGPDPAVARWPSWPDRVTCNGVQFDPVAAFGGPTNAENGAGGPELALRRYLDEGLYPQLPTRFWRVAAATPTRVAFASGLLEQGLFWLEFELAGDQWRFAGDPGECRPRTIRDDGNVAIGWTPSRTQVLKSGSRRVEVNLHSGLGCDGGREENPVAEPEFRQVGRRLVLTIWLPPLTPGPHTCPARIEPPLSLTLPGRLGKRQLWDGGTYPPKRRR